METTVITTCSFVKCWGELTGIAVVIGGAIVVWRQHRKIAAQRGTLDFLLKNAMEFAQHGEGSRRLAPHGPHDLEA